MPKRKNSKPKRDSAAATKSASKPASRAKAPANKSTDNFAIVAIGASAGGIEAVSELLKNLSPDTGMGFVLIQHLDPHHHSMLTELLSRITKMPVSEVTSGARVNPNHLYVIPPNTSMSITDHVLKLRPRDESRGVHMPIDFFMRSLAEADGNRSVGVILSGAGTDGALGIAEIQAQGGVTFAQDEASARYNSMPRSAVASGAIDYVLPPSEIARELARIASVHDHQPVEAQQPAFESSALSSIYQLLRRVNGLDFTHYRQTTITRRIQRRMVVHKFEKIRDYTHYLQTHDNEVRALYQDMLINVTSFFRNPALFDLLKSIVYPTIMKHRHADAAIRVWAPGCASGEETFSLAITLLEFLGEDAAHIPMQFFGTDVSETAINKARTGIYPENISEDVSPERLKRFFTRIEGGYRISKAIRDMCIFAQHNVLNDPPFSQIDLICCRNLLIYLEPILQNKVLSLFHYAAKPHGFLALGTAEGLGISASLFTTEDRSYKIYSKKTTATRQVVAFTLNRSADRSLYGSARASVRAAEPLSFLEIQKEFDRKLLTQFAPAAVFINADLEVVHSRGHVNRYLKLAPGRASLSILKMAREGLLFDLRNAINRAKKERDPVRRSGILTKTGDGNGHPKGSPDRLVSFQVVPLSFGNSRELYFMIVFQEDQVPAPAAKTRSSKAGSRQPDPEAVTRINKLEQELDANKEYLQSVIETQEATNEELQSANEEILSSNEELQSTNEELETAKEELQSANEELSTVNDELRARNADISAAYVDMTNLLASMDMAVVTLGPDITIRRFTPQAEKLLGLIPADIGRPFLNLNPSIQVPDLQQMVLKVMNNYTPLEKEIDTPGRGHFLLRILPYRSAEGRTEGAVFTLMQINRDKDRSKREDQQKDRESEAAS
jgi:two-component system, chemotaxis family, CheB/CheR fusion protein